MRNHCPKHGELSLNQIQIRHGIPRCIECGAALEFKKIKKEVTKMKRERRDELVNKVLAYVKNELQLTDLEIRLVLGRANWLTADNIKKAKSEVKD